MCARGSDGGPRSHNYGNSPATAGKPATSPEIPWADWVLSPLLGELRSPCVPSHSTTEQGCVGWNDEAEAAFAALTLQMAATLVLALPDFSQPF